MMNVCKDKEFFGKVAVITGGGGILCGVLARALAAHGATVVLVDIRLPVAQAAVEDICRAGGQAAAFEANVIEKSSLEKLREDVVRQFGHVDILLNGAGGNQKGATTGSNQSFMQLSEESIRGVMDLNFLGTLFPCQVFASQMVKQNSGVILNIGSMSALRPLTKVAIYSAAKAAVVNFTQWLAVHLAQEYTGNIRVNALVPGFFLTEQNRFLLTDEKTGQVTPRGQTVLDHTPMKRWGVPEDLVGPGLFLLSDAAAFVHGTTLVVDGGMGAFSGV